MLLWFHNFKIISLKQMFKESDFGTPYLTIGIPLFVFIICEITKLPIILLVFIHFKVKIINIMSSNNGYANTNCQNIITYFNINLYDYKVKIINNQNAYNIMYPFLFQKEKYWTWCSVYTLYTKVRTKLCSTHMHFHQLNQHQSAEQCLFQCKWAYISPGNHPLFYSAVWSSPISSVKMFSLLSL